MGSLGNDGAQTLGPDGPSLRMEMVGWSGFLPSPSLVLLARARFSKTGHFKKGSIGSNSWGEEPWGVPPSRKRGKILPSRKDPRKEGGPFSLLLLLAILKISHTSLGGWGKFPVHFVGHAAGCVLLL